MNLIADEGVDRSIVARLRIEGHRVWYVAEMAPTTPDSEILAIASGQQALLITYDKDFGEIVFRQNQVHHGVLLLRLEGMSSENKSDLIASTLKAHEQDLKNGFGVLSPGHFRVRPQRFEIL